MSETKFFRNLLMFIMIYSTLLLKKAASENYIVGDDQRWNSDLDFHSWSLKYNFTTADVLVFKYVKGQHNVYEVTEETYRSCDTSIGVIGKYESGNDEIKINKAKKYWFICNVSGHCLGGMRFMIEVKEISPSSNFNRPIADISPAQEPTSEANSSRSSMIFGKNLKVGIYIVVTGSFYFISGY